MTWDAVCRSPRWQAFFVAIGTVLVSAIIVFTSPGLGPNDEEVHLDYVMKVGRLYVPASGDPMEQEALRIEACRGFYGPYQPPKVCDQPGPLDPAAFQFNGESRAWSHAPVYYAITRVLMTPLLALGVDFVNAARVVTSLWTAAALALLWLIFARLGIRWTVAASLLVIVALNQAVLQRAVNVSNDATAVFSGALLLYLVVRNSRLSILVLAAILVTALKFQNVFAVICAATACLVGLSWYVNRNGKSASMRSRMIRAMWLMMGAASAVFVWRLLQRSGAGSVAGNADVLTRNGSLPRADDFSRLVAENILAYSRPFQTVESYLPAYVKVPQFFALDVVANLVFVAVVISAPFIFSMRTLTFRMAVPAVVGLIAAPPLVAAAIGVSIGFWAEWPPRYGLSVIPFIVVAVAVAVQRRQGIFIIAAIAAAYVTLMLVGITRAVAI